MAALRKPLHNGVDSLSIMGEPAFRGQLPSAGEPPDLSFLDKDFTYQSSLA
jgi:hypothetical protein